MLSRRYKLCSEWLNNLMIMLLFITGFEYLHFVTGLRSSVYFYAAAAVLVSASYLQRVYISRLPVYLIVHLACAAAVILIPFVIYHKIMLIVVAFVLAASDLAFWTGGEVRSFLPVHPVLSLGFACVFAYASLKGAVGLERLSYVSGILFLSFCFLRIYLDNGIRYAKNARSDDSGSVDDMLRRNTRLVILLVICFTAWMFLFQSKAMTDALSRAVRAVFGLIGRLLTFLISLLPKGTAGAAEEVAQRQPGLPLEYGTVPEWVLIAFMALEKVISVFGAVLIVYLVLKLIVRFFITYFYRYGYDAAGVDCGDHTEKREWIVGKTALKRHGSRLFPATYREKVRRRYKKEVMRLKRSGYPLTISHTPAERLSDIELNHPDIMDDHFVELSHEYENVRYTDMI